MSAPQAAAALPQRVRAFPFPFPQEVYRYTANVQPAPALQPTAAGGWGATTIDADEFYLEELRERDAILAADDQRSVTLPHMQAAVWDAIRYCLAGLAESQPEAVRVVVDGTAVHYENDLLGQRWDFVLGDASTLPEDPLTWLGRQVQEDICLLDQRDGALWLDAGLVTFPADWSVAFDLGMAFQEFHGPVPRAHEAGIFQAAEQFLMRLTPEQAYRRTNWTLTIDRRMDVSTELYPVWGRDRRLLTAKGVGERVHLRVEVQHLIRLPVSGAILFLIRTYMLPLHEVALVPHWLERSHDVIAELPDDIADYKGFIRYRPLVVDWLGAQRAEAHLASWRDT